MAANVSFNNGVYQMHNTSVSNDVTEILVRHIDWTDFQHDVEAKSILIAPEGAFLVTDSGLHPVRDEDRLWDCIPKLINLDEDGDPYYYSDNRAANEVIEYLKSCISAVCPNWDATIPGRRQSRRR